MIKEAVSNVSDGNQFRLVWLTDVLDPNGGRVEAQTDTLASRIATQFPNAVNKLHTSALFYLAVILLVIGLVTNLIAVWIGRRFDHRIA